MKKIISLICSLALILTVFTCIPVITGSAASTADVVDGIIGKGEMTTRWLDPSYEKIADFYDEPLDFSDSSGIIRVKTNTSFAGKFKYRIVIYASGKEFEYESEYYQMSGEVNHTYNLSDFSGLTDDDLKSVEGYTVEAAGDGTIQSAYWSWNIAALRKDPTVSDTIEAGKTITTIAEAEDLVEETVSFKYGLDAHGGNGVIVVTENIASPQGVLWMLDITTKSGKVGSYTRDTMEITGETTTTITVEEMGLEDADLKHILSYTITVLGEGEASDWTFSVKVPKDEAVVTEVLDENVSFSGSKGWGNDWFTRTKEYDTPLDLSGAKVFKFEIVLSEAYPAGGEIGVFCSLQITTLTKTSYKISKWSSYPVADKVREVYFTLEELGLESNDLNRVYSYSFEGTNNGNGCQYTYSLYAPSEIKGFSDYDYSEDNYVIADGALNLPARTNVADFTTKYYSSKVYAADGTEVTEGSLETGMTAKIEFNGEVIDTIPLVVEEAKEAVVSNAIEAGTTITTKPWGGTSSKEVTFDTPINASGSDGKLIVTESVTVEHTYAFDLYIITENKVSGVYSRAYPNDYFSTNVTEIPLADLGLTDEDLACVLGYKMYVYGAGDAASYTFTIHAYKPGEEPEIPEEPEVPEQPEEPEDIPADAIVDNWAITSGTWWQWSNVLSEKNFSPARDMSGSNGTIEVTVTGDTTGVYYYQVFIVINGKEYNLSRMDDPVVSGTTTTYNLADLGLTDDDLKNVTKIQSNACNSSGEAQMILTVKVPRASTEPEEPEATKTDTVVSDWTIPSGAWGQWSDVLSTQEFSPALDLSGSNGTLEVTVTGESSGDYYYQLFLTIGGKEYDFSSMSTPVKSGTVRIINLADHNLTDDDLKNVTMIQSNACFTDSTSSMTITVKAPRASTEPEEPEATKTDTIAGNWYITSGTWGQWSDVRTNQTFSPALDASGSNGTIEVTVRGDESGVYYFQLYLTIGGKEYNFSRQNDATTHGTTITYNLADYGLTDDDLKNITYVWANACNTGGTNQMILDIKVPRPVTTPAFGDDSYADSGYEYSEGKFFIDTNANVADIIAVYAGAVVYDAEGNVVTDGILKTGMTIKVENNGEVVDEAKIIINNDVDKDGLLTAADLVEVMKALLGEVLDADQEAALDCHGFEEVSLLNLIRMKKLLAKVD